MPDLTQRQASVIRGFFRPFRPLLKGWLLSFAVFALLALVLVGQFALAVSMPWQNALRTAARDWLPWAVLTPLIFRLVSRLPLERSRGKIAWVIHISCGIATIALCNWWAESVLPPRGGPGGRRPEPRGEMARTGKDNLRTPPSPPRGPPRGEGPRRPPFNAFFLIGFRLPIYLAIVSVAHAVLFSRRSQERDRLEASLAKARIEALKMQLQPHFLFNSLNSIAALVHRDPHAADEMLAGLSDLLRLTIESSGEQELPLSEELKFVERYLAIEHVRFGERLRFEIEIAPEVRAAMVPTFLLQPLVENAVHHGLEPQQGAGLLSIRAWREGSRLRLTVADNGPGLADGPAHREGIGLPNTRARLSELYGDAATLELKSGEGMKVEISLPFRLAP